MSYVLVDAVLDLDLPTGEKAVLAVLAKYANDKGGSSFPGNDRIAHGAGMTVRSVRVKLAALGDRALIYRARYPKGGRGHAVEWKLAAERIYAESAIYQASLKGHAHDLLSDAKEEGSAPKEEADVRKGGRRRTPNLSGTNHESTKGLLLAISEARSDREVKNPESVGRFRYEQRPGYYDHLALEAEGNTKGRDTTSDLTGIGDLLYASDGNPSEADVLDLLHRELGTVLVAELPYELIPDNAP